MNTLTLERHTGLHSMDCITYGARQLLNSSGDALPEPLMVSPRWQCNELLWLHSSPREWNHHRSGSCPKLAGGSPAPNIAVFLVVAVLFYLVGKLVRYSLLPTNYSTTMSSCRITMDQKLAKFEVFQVYQTQFQILWLGTGKLAVHCWFW